MKLRIKMYDLYTCWKTDYAVNGHTTLRYRLDKQHMFMRPYQRDDNQ